MRAPSRRVREAPPKASRRPLLRRREGLAPLALALLVALPVHDAVAKPQKPSAPAASAGKTVHHAAPRAEKQAGPLPMLPSIAHVKVEVLKDTLVVVEEVTLPRGEWNGQPLDLYVAFGAPGAPRAIDAHLVPIEDGALESDPRAVGDALPISRAARRPASAVALLGRETMAGITIRVDADAMRRALAPGNMAALRVRSALELPEVDPAGAQGVVVRLGASSGRPLTLGRLALVGRAGGPLPTRADAHLCGPDADASALAIALEPRSSARPTALPSPVRPIAPVLAVRHPSDDLCIRFWTS